MKIQVEVDVTDIANYFDREDGNFDDEIKSAIKYKVIDLMVQQMDLQSIKTKFQKEYEVKIKEFYDNVFKENSRWLEDNEAALAINKHLSSMLTSTAVAKLALFLKRDADFIKSVAQEVLKPTPLSAP